MDNYPCCLAFCCLWLPKKDLERFVCFLKSSVISASVCWNYSYRTRPVLAIAALNPFFSILNYGGVHWPSRYNNKLNSLNKLIKETWPISINLWKLVWISLWFSVGLIYKKKEILFFLCIWQLCCFLPQFMLLRKIYFPEVCHLSYSLWHDTSLPPLTTLSS